MYRKKGGEFQPSFSPKASSHPMQMSSLLKTFMDYLEHTKNVSPRTLMNYRLWINRAIAFLGDPSVESLKSLHILQFRMHLNDS